MSLEKNIEEKLKASLKNKDKTVYPTLRLIISSIKDFKIAQKIRENDRVGMIQASELDPCILL